MLPIWPFSRSPGISPAAMMNVLGEPGYSGPARYVGFEEAYAMEGVFVHLYGKKETRPWRRCVVIRFW